MAQFDDLAGAWFVVIGSALTAMSFVVMFADGLGRHAVDGFGRSVFLVNLAMFVFVVLAFLLLVDVLMTEMWDCLVMCVFWLAVCVWNC